MAKRELSEIINSYREELEKTISVKK